MSSTATTATLCLDGEVTIYRAAELRDTLLSTISKLAPGEALELDLAEVSEIDSAGVQLLMAARKTAQASSRELRLTRHSPAVLEVFELLDLAAHFGDQLLMPAIRH